MAYLFFQTKSSKVIIDEVTEESGLPRSEAFLDRIELFGEI